MKPVDVYLSLGSNQGDRQAMLDEALRRLDAAIGRPRAALSSVIETPAWGFDGPAFLNCVVRYRTARRPHTLLRICKRIERAMGRRETLERFASGMRLFVVGLAKKALLAAYMLRRDEGESLPDYLDNRVFAGAESTTLMATEEEIAGFDAFLKRYLAAFPAEKAAIETLC